MLIFFRKYERLFLIIITVVIITSFSFFGTYSAFTDRAPQHEIAFTAVDGARIARSDLEALALFIGSDAQDKLIFGGASGPNFLNDGVIQKDFLETGMAAQLARAYPQELSGDLNSRLKKEKSYRFYQNPQAKFLNAPNAWNYFAPEISLRLKELKQFEDGKDPEAFAARTDLYLAERKFPAPLLKKVLKYQEQQFSWLPADPNLDYTDLSMYGYHTVEDWFGPHFVRLVAQFIINASHIAEQKGYEVSKDEAVADLYQNAQASFEQNRKSSYVNSLNQKEYLEEQLRRMGMDVSHAANLWRQVMLFRRLFHDFGNTIVVDTLSDREFLGYSNSYVKGDLYHLPDELKINQFRNLQLLEFYLSAVTDSGYKKGTLAMPVQFLSPEKVAKAYPELVQRKYQVEVSLADISQLYSKIPLKDLWKWQKETDNFAMLKKQFPEVNLNEPKTFEERFAKLEALDRTTRAKIDAFSRAEIVQEHPEWIKEALDHAPKTKQTLSLRKERGPIALPGISDPQQLSSLLDEAPLKESTAAPEQYLEQYSQDQKHYYRIRVLEKSPKEEVLTFKEAKEDGTLNGLLQEALHNHYLKIREHNPGEFQKSDQSWKELREVEERVAENYFQPIIDTLKKESGTPEASLASLASFRLKPYMETLQKQIQKNPENAKLYRTSSQPVSSEKDPLSTQWELVKSSYEVKRNEGSTHANLFDLALGQWSGVETFPDGNIIFFHLNEKGQKISDKELAQKVNDLHRILSEEGQRTLMANTLEEISKRGAISLDYLNKGKARDE